jgi:hypothetical protein
MCGLIAGLAANAVSSAQTAVALPYNLTGSWYLQNRRGARLRLARGEKLRRNLHF